MKIYKNYLILFLQLFLFIFTKSTYANDFETWKLSLIKQAVEAGISEKVIRKKGTKFIFPLPKMSIV